MKENSMSFTQQEPKQKSHNKKVATVIYAIFTFGVLVVFMALSLAESDRTRKTEEAQRVRDEQASIACQESGGIVRFTNYHDQLSLVLDANGEVACFKKGDVSK